MRDLTPSEDAALGSARRSSFIKVLIEDGDGDWKDLTTIFPGMKSAIKDAEWGENNDSQLGSATINIERSAGGLQSLSPLNLESDLNQITAGYSPLIDVGRPVQIWATTMAEGSVPDEEDFHLVFEGEVRKWNAEKNPMPLDIVGKGYALNRAWIRDKTVYGVDGGKPVADVIQEVLNDWAGGEELIVEGAPNFAIVPYEVQVQRVLEGINQLATSTIGWIVRYRWHPPSGEHKLTLREPARTPTAADWSFGPGMVYSYQNISVESDEVRNDIEIEYTNKFLNKREKVSAQVPDSIDRFGNQWMRLSLSSDSPISSATEAGVLLEAAKSDLAYPPAEGTIEVPFHWPVQLDDYYEFPADGRIFTETQTFAVVGYRHFFSQNKRRTTLQVRGQAAGYVRGWIRKGYDRRGPVEDLRQRSIFDLKTYEDLDLGLVTITAKVGDLVKFVLVNDNEYLIPIATDFSPWPGEDESPDTIIEPSGAPREFTYVTDMPPERWKRFIQFHPKDALNRSGKIRRVEVIRPPMQSVADIPPGAIVSAKMVKSAQLYDFSNEAWSKVSDDQVDWSSDTLKFSDGTSYTIASGSTGNMTGGFPYYIYWTLADPTHFNVTQDWGLVNTDNVVLMAVARKANNPDTLAFLGTAVGVVGLSDVEINARAIVAGNIRTNTITGVEIFGTSVSGIFGDFGIMTAGIIQNGTGTFIMDLDATGSDPLLLVTDGVDTVVEIDANGDAFFGGTITAAAFTAANPRFDGELTVRGGTGFDSVVIYNDGIWIQDDTFTVALAMYWSGLAAQGIIIGGNGGLLIDSTNFTTIAQIGDLAFFGASPVGKQTSVPVTAAGIHAALTAYGLIS